LYCLIFLNARPTPYTLHTASILAGDRKTAQTLEEGKIRHRPSSPRSTRCPPCPPLDGRTASSLTASLHIVRTAWWLAQWVGASWYAMLPGSKAWLLAQLALERACWRVPKDAAHDCLLFVGLV
jgi:hypothetical protein